MSDTFSPDIKVTTAGPSRRFDAPIRQILGWIVVAAAAAAAVIVPLTGAPAAAQTIALLGVALAVVQGTRRYGWGTLLAFFVISYVVSSIWENLSVMTGFPFGNYYYTLMPQLFYVPVFIGFAYFGIGFVSWMTANTILDRADEKLDLRTRAGRINTFALPLLAGAVMTMFDVGIDSISSTVRNAWVWEDGGGVFGVPFTNYLGWWFVTWSFFQVFALVLAVRQTRRPAGTADGLPRISHLQPVLLYMMFGISSIFAFLGFTDADTVVDTTGMTWSTPAVFETLMIFNVFSIIPVSLFAITKIARGDLSRA
jgi:putative membrane protein